ncbi:hypothetical protein BKH46_03280 [Helicobacter sp. 12S02634-8]|uniref:DUF815 domain-containing protein n=1 Tax=Helicobacter sp. 12S02634-8 TaxID=1476199 RepID=UPI000BA6F02B|nr:DUF815 domain-containing protein [Helicobacter sp. 12S02634-8]PAF47476.1 hypothetical protein BKH46_03280 [Helicobacter sp. 12S02634-8]
MNFEYDWSISKACIFRNYNGGYLHKITDFDRVDAKKLLGLDKEIATLEKNTEAFCRRKAASNALIWGARGCGKSSMVKAVFTRYLYELDTPLRVVEIDKGDLWVLPFLIDDLRTHAFCFVVYCDDLSFEARDQSYKPLKSILEGSLEKKPDNVLVYATSNRRHLVAEYENTQEIHQNDVWDELLSLSDRFGLSMGVYALGAEEYLSILASMCASVEEFEALKMPALNYAGIKGNRSGRSAQEFYRLYQNGLI